LEFEFEHYKGGMHFYAAFMEHPKNFKPTFYVNYQAKLPGLEMNDDLTKFYGILYMPQVI
jgi:hypothetical protein